MSFVVIIPARYASTRLPGKPLVDINGKPMVVHVLERARESGADRIIVATDHPDVASVVEAAGGQPAIQHGLGHGLQLAGADHLAGGRHAALPCDKRFGCHLQLGIAPDQFGNLLAQLLRRTVTHGFRLGEPRSARG